MRKGKWAEAREKFAQILQQQPGFGEGAVQGYLTATEKEAIACVLADHPTFAPALARRAAAWEAFLAAHPAVAAEIAKVKALPADQRRAELKKWLADHPDARKAIHDWRTDARKARQGQRQDRRKARQDRRGDAGTASATSLSV